MTIVRSTLTYYWNEWFCKLTGRFRAHPPDRPDYSGVYISQDYDLKKRGDCDRGSYIEIYSPKLVYSENDTPPRVVIYLHGFDLGASQIYRSHIEHLVKQGFYVFYPNFQTGFCSFPDSTNSRNDFFESVEELIQSTIGEGLIAPQGEWMENALNSVESAYSLVFGESNPVDTYLFGHSLGGLFALSWAYYVDTENRDPRLRPKQVVAADPVTDTETINFPGKLGKIIDKFTDKVDIRTTGSHLDVPVAIVHGNDDVIVPKAKWNGPFEAIATEHKAMFLSFSDAYGCPAMYANHEQATTDTSFFPRFLALTILDGVGAENDLDWRYIWHALDYAVRGGDTVKVNHVCFEMGNWSDGHPVIPIQRYLPVTTEIEPEERMLG